MDWKNILVYKTADDAVFYRVVLRSPNLKWQLSRIICTDQNVGNSIQVLVNNNQYIYLIMDPGKSFWVDERRFRLSGRYSKHLDKLILTMCQLAQWADEHDRLDLASMQTNADLSDLNVCQFFIVQQCITSSSSVISQHRCHRNLQCPISTVGTCSAFRRSLFCR